LYYLASGNFKLGEFKKAISQVDELLRIEPGNEQFITLKGKVSKKLQKGSKAAAPY
jgi:predicted Zn-dependent protease